jgi:hypothetical protein
MHRTRLKLLSAFFVASVFGVASLEAPAAAFAQQTSSDRGVTVRATQRDLSSTAKAWEFDIVLETHSQNLTDDVKAGAVLVAGGGAKHAPLSWEGDPPGGHHRKGVLRFAPVSPLPDAIELRVQRPEEPAPRSFRWALK